jgi:hypothetical protein
MPTEHLSAALRALRRYERVQARLLAGARSSRKGREEEVAHIRKLIARSAESMERESLVRLVAKRMNPIEPCSFEDAHSRFVLAMGLLPVLIFLALGIATVLERVMS